MGEDPVAQVADKPFTTTCSNCRNVIDVTGFEPGVGITCPYCNYEFLLTRLFGNFLLERQLGAGTMGSVYLAKDLTLNRVVAVKVLKREFGSDKKFMTTFTRVAQLSASLNHPNIVHVYTFGEYEGSHYLVIEYISGGSLNEKITQRGGRIAEFEAIEIGLAVSRVLEAALQRGLIHRDIKPGNILFTNNTPKVADFGLSLCLKTIEYADPEIPYYVSPEILERQSEDFRSDMYSLMATLYHAISGRTPYEGDNRNAVATKHLSSKAPPLKTVVPEISDKMSFIVSKGLSRYPEDRFESYKALIEELEEAKRAFTEPNFQSQPLPNVVLPEPEEEKPKFNVGLIVGLAAVLVILLGLFIWKETSGNAPARAPVTSAGTFPPVNSTPSAVNNPTPAAAPVVNNTPQPTPTPIYTPPPAPVPVPMPPAVQEQPSVPGGYSEIISKSSGLYVTVKDDNQGDNAMIVQSADPSRSGQWQFVQLPSGNYEILNASSDKSMAIQHAQKTPQAQLIQYRFDTRPSKTYRNDEWIVESTTGGNYKFTNVNSNMVLAVSDNSQGTVLEQDPWTGADNQQFRIAGTLPSGASAAGSSSPAPAETAVATPGPADLNYAGYSQIISKSSGLSVIVEDASTSKGGTIVQGTGGGTSPEDQWQFIPLGNGHYQIKNRNSNMVMHVWKDLTDPGNKIVQWSKVAHILPREFSDEWNIELVSNGYYKITNVYTTLALEIKSNSKSEGARLDQAPWTGKSNQLFKIVNLQNTQ
ncbi:MAG TPA: RICIN domain-containing protein [Candidatus Methylacidiphilales bacterium]|nr:RICIN domain-containing protein [Candidatus Methylacidiphilales bacterium]